MQSPEHFLCTYPERPLNNYNQETFYAKTLLSQQSSFNYAA